MKDLKEKVSITLDSNVATQIRLLADEDDRNFSQYINMVLKNHIKNKKANFRYSISESSVYSDMIADESQKK